MPKKASLRREINELDAPVVLIAYGEAIGACRKHLPGLIQRFFLLAMHEAFSSEIGLAMTFVLF